MKFATAILAGAMVFAGTAAYAQDVAGDAAAGEKVFNKCKACHSVEGQNKVGPHLNGVIGRTAGTVEDYKYSKAMHEAGENGLVWDAPTLETYLVKPKDLVKGTKMAFAGLKKKEDIDNVIAYLEQFSGE